jgi:hypothetical protein
MHSCVRTAIWMRFFLEAGAGIEVLPFGNMPLDVVSTRQGATVGLWQSKPLLPNPQPCAAKNSVSLSFSLRVSSAVTG